MFIVESLLKVQWERIDALGVSKMSPNLLKVWKSKNIVFMFIFESSLKRCKYVPKYIKMYHKQPSNHTWYCTLIKYIQKKW